MLRHESRHAFDHGLHVERRVVRVEIYYCRYRFNASALPTASAALEEARDVRSVWQWKADRSLLTGRTQTMPTITPNSEPTASERLQLLLTRAEAGDLSTLPELRRVLDQDRSLWEHYGNLAQQAQAGLIKLAAGSNLLLSESIIRKQSALKAELAGDSTDPVVRALAERAAICSLQVGFFDGLLAGSKGSTVAQLRPLQVQLDGANRRYLNALKTLATVQKLLRPTLSPLAVATRIDGRKAVRRENDVHVGVGVAN